MKGQAYLNDQCQTINMLALSASKGTGDMGTSTKRGRRVPGSKIRTHAINWVLNIFFIIILHPYLCLHQIRFGEQAQDHEVAC